MERFVRRQNVRHYRELLVNEKDEAKRRVISKLLVEELQKQKEAGDQPDEERQAG